MSTGWTNEEVCELKRLVFRAKNDKQIAERFDILSRRGALGFPVERTPEAIARKRRRLNLSKVNTTDQNSVQSVREAIGQIIELGKKYKLNEERITTGLVDQPARKILCMSDMHIPFTQWDVVSEIVQEHSDADVVVLNGDIMDGYAFSTFTKSQRIQSLVEYQMMFALVKRLSELFKDIVIVSGNHEARTYRSLGNLSSEEKSVFQADLPARIANGEELDDYGLMVKKHDFKNVHYDRAQPWYNLIGRTVFAHPSGYSGAHPGATAMKTMQMLDQKIGPGRYDALVIGHTHRIYSGIVNGKLLIEQGALASRMAYEGAANLKFKPAMRGYAVVVQDANGRTDFNRSRPYYLGFNVEPKRTILQ